MTGLMITFVIIGIVFMVGSFFVTEKISPSELNRIAKLSEDELKGILEREMKKADAQMEERVDAVITDSLQKTERLLDKETNEKIMAINEYSNTVFEDMKKTHDEIMFLYSMLNDRHTELIDMSGKLQELITRLDKIRQKQESVAEAKEKLMEEAEKIPVVMEEKKPGEQPVEQKEEERPEEFAETCEEQMNHNSSILSLYEEGRTAVEIARELGLGVGEVKLVLDLYKGDRNS